MGKKIKVYNKISALLLAAAVVIMDLPAFALPVHAEEISVVGDVRNDGVLDVRDLIRFKRILGSEEIESGSRGTVDLNADKVVNATDIRIERRLLLGSGYRYKDTSWALAAGTVQWSHGFSEGWKAVSVCLADNTEQELVKSGEYYYIDKDETKSAFLNRGHIMPAEDYDLAYVYTMPCKATIDLVINGSVQEDDTDGSVIYAYINDRSRCIVNRKVITNTGNKSVASADSITLNKGDRLYIRMNKNDTVPAGVAAAIDELGWFYAKITYTKIYPEEVSAGKAYDEITWQDMAGRTSYSHGSLTDTAVYANWEYKSVNLADASEEDMVVINNNKELRYVNGDTSAYVRQKNQYAVPGKNHDVMYVYTMPVTAKVKITLNASANANSTVSDPDGVYVYCYINDKSNGLIRESVTSATKQSFTVDNVILEKGDKIYFRLNNNGVFTKNAYGVFYGAVTYKNEAPTGAVYQGEDFGNVTWAEAAKGVGTVDGVTTAHLSIDAGDDASLTYPGWDYKAVNLSGGEIVNTIINSKYPDVRYSPSSSVYIRKKNNGAFQVTNAYDMMYVYTMPCKAKVNVAITAKTTSGSAVVSAYVNEESNGLLRRTVKNGDTTNTYALNAITLDKGAKIYFRVNGAGATAKGIFTGTVTFLSETPDAEVYQGGEFGEDTNSGT